MELRADCANCLALCCVGLAFASPADFAIAKPAGEPCPNLASDLRCRIHETLAERGFPGCVAFDCFGAGQRVSASAGGDWRRSPREARALFAALPVVTRLHELLWYLDDLARRPACAPLADEVAEAIAAIDERAGRAAVADIDTDIHTDIDTAAAQAEVAPVLRRGSALVRGPGGADLAHADRAGRSLRGADLRGADLRGALLLGADLRDARLDRADLIGADLRGADLRGARLDDALFVTAAQVGAARGDSRTSLPDRLARPAHW